MSREQKMLAVVEAARVVLRERLGWDAAAWEVACARLDAALATLDAHTEAPQEVVTLAVWRVGDHYELTVPGLLRGTHCLLRGTLTLPLTPEGGR